MSSSRTGRRSCCYHCLYSLLKAFEARLCSRRGQEFRLDAGGRCSGGNRDQAFSSAQCKKLSL